MQNESSVSLNINKLGAYESAQPTQTTHRGRANGPKVCPQPAEVASRTPADRTRHNATAATTTDGLALPASLVVAGAGSFWFSLLACVRLISVSWRLSCDASAPNMRPCHCDATGQHCYSHAIPMLLGPHQIRRACESMASAIEHLPCCSLASPLSFTAKLLLLLLFLLLSLLPRASASHRRADALHFPAALVRKLPAPLCRHSRASRKLTSWRNK